MFIVRIFQNVKMRWKVLFLVVAFVIMSYVAGIMGMRGSARLQANVTDLDANYTSVAVNVGRAETNGRALNGIIAMMTAADSPSEIRRLASEYETYKERMIACATFYSEHLINPRRQRDFDTMYRAWEAIEKRYAQIVELAAAGRRRDASELFALPETKTLESTFLGSLADEASALVREIADYNAKIQADVAYERNVMIGVLITIFISGILTNLLVSFSMTRPILKLLGSINVLASGDLRAEVDWYGRDEIAEMGSAIESLEGALNSAIGAADKASDDLNDAADHFSAMVDKTNSAVEQFKGHVDGMTDALRDMASAGEEVNASVREVSAGAHTTAQKGTDIARLVEEAMTVGDNGMAAVRKVVGGVSEVAASSSHSADAIMELGERARQIQSFVSQIGGIADQTNLLALNAAIEAARAGEAGRGFAVVAEEVRKLAEDSNVAAKSIADLASTITGTIDEIVQAAQNNAKMSTSAKELSDSTETAIERMIEILRGISEATQDLAAVSEEQAASSSEIAETIHQMAERVSQTAETGEELRRGVVEIADSSMRIATGADDLKKMSNDLSQELSFFTIREGAASRQGMRALPR